MSEEIKKEKPKRLFRNSEKGSDWGVKADCKIFKSWEHGELNTMLATRKLAKRNEWIDFTEDEFVEMAHGLGYYKEGS